MALIEELNGYSALQKRSITPVTGVVLSQLQWKVTLGT